MCVQTGQMTADAVLSQMEYEYGLYQYEDLDGAPISINSSLVLTRKGKDWRNGILLWKGA